MYRRIKYPYKGLTELELNRIQEFKQRNNLGDTNIYVTYVTDDTLGIGYDIIVSHNKPYKKNGRLHFGFIVENITDEENMLNNI